MEETTKLLSEIKEELARKDETYALIADSKPGADCRCKSCMIARTRDYMHNSNNRSMGLALFSSKR